MTITDLTTYLHQLISSAFLEVESFCISEALTLPLRKYCCHHHSHHHNPCNSAKSKSLVFSLSSLLPFSLCTSVLAQLVLDTCSQKASTHFGQPPANIVQPQGCPLGSQPSFLQPRGLCFLLARLFTSEQLP